MKKLLILSYFFPPGNFAGSYRIKAWAEHLHKFGYYPIVVTRHWAENETDFTGISEELEIKKEDFGHYTVYRLPFKGSFRDRLVKEFGPKTIPLGKILSFFQVIGQNYFLRSIPYRNIFDFSRELLKENPEIELVLTSGRPFIHFKFAYLLKKEFPYIEWIADYRDPWNSCSNINDSIKLQFFQILETPLEKKWIKNAAFFTAVSEGVKESIKGIIGEKTGYVIYNGFDIPKANSSIGIKKKSLVISYVGTLYPQQKIEVFLEGYKLFINSIPDPKINLVFWGLQNNTEQALRVKNVLRSFEDYYEVLPWLEKELLKEELDQSDLFLVSGIPNRKGTLTAKIFDYFSLKRPIVLSPSDNDILEETIKKTNSGIVLNTPEDVSRYLVEIYDTWSQNKTIPFFGEDLLIEQFSYENQVKKLAELLDRLKGSFKL